MLEAFGVSKDDIEDCIIASVVPPVFNSVQTGVLKVIGKQPMVVGPGLKTGLNIHVDIPSQVGSDLIVAAVAALAEYPAPLVLIDLGTATTVEVIEPENVFVGGLIFPGIMVSLDSLTNRAAQLPGISLDQPKKVIGKNTVDCMRSGMMYGTAAMLDGLIDRIAEGYVNQNNVLHFAPPLKGGQLRELAEKISALCTGYVAVFSPKDGGFSYCLAQPEGDLHQLCKDMNATLSGRGGGKPAFQQGTVNATEEKIRDFFSN